MLQEQGLLSDCVHQGILNNRSRMKGTCMRFVQALFQEGATTARHVTHMPFNIFSLADNGILWQGKFLFSYAEPEREVV